MSRTWWLRIAGTAAAWAAAVTALALLEMRPAVVALAAIVVAGAVVLWVLLDLGDVAEPVEWRATSDLGAATRHADTRLLLLYRRVADQRALDQGHALHRGLVELVDDALRSRHGVDRAVDPGAAAAVLGPQLAAFVTGAAVPRAADPVQLAALLDRIEHVCLGPAAPSATVPFTSSATSSTPSAAPERR